MIRIVPWIDTASASCGSWLACCRVALAAACPNYPAPDYNGRIMSRLALRIAFCALLLTSFCHAAAGVDGWQLLKSLAGDWHATTSEGKDMQMSYQVISNGSAVMEIMKAPDGSPLMVTIYHRDGAAFVATHYCAAGNQPRMRAKPVVEAGNRLAFRFQDVTNLSTPEAQHIHDLAITFQDADHVTQEWTSREHAKDSTAVFRLTRKH